MLNGELKRLLKTLQPAVDSVIDLCEKSQSYEDADRDVCIDLCRSLDSVSTYIKSMLAVRKLEQGEKI